MKIYNYSSGTGEFLSTARADESPLEPGVFLMPAHSTALVPPEPSEGQVAVFQAGVWQCVVDQRGEWYDAIGRQCFVHQLDEDTSALTRLVPPGEFHELVSGVWVLNDSWRAAHQLDRFKAAIQKRLDEFASTRNYDGILSACTYATSTIAKFRTEGQACVNLRDATWAAAYQILADVQAGDRPMPASIADIEADLPAAVWPA